MQNPKQPGVYIVEKNAFPNSVVEVETAVPAFIGYTQKAEFRGKSLLRVPTKISSFNEYVAMFGTGFSPRFKIMDAPTGTKEETILLNGKNMQVVINDNNDLNFYSCIKLFYANGGNSCYILSVGTYEDKPGGFAMDITDFTSDNKKPNVFHILEKEAEPSLVVMPDLVFKGTAAYPVYRLALEHCAKMKNRFAIFDVWQSNTQNMDDDISQFRGKDKDSGVGTEFLNYGAAYYPWLLTSVVHENEIDFTNLDPSVDLAVLLPEAPTKKIAADMKGMQPAKLNAERKNLQQALRASSPTYVKIMKMITAKLNLLPPSAAMAGIYTTIDNSFGVWKAPANISVNNVVAPSINISDEQQESLNVDIIAGKSVNAIRTFVGQGVLVWGARTLDGNSLDWRYINVRRTMIMIEESLKLAIRSYIFEPNDANTWNTVKSMMNNFLATLWGQRALQGAIAEDAFSIDIGLGSTMTSQDVLDGILRVSVKVAVTHPGEYIELTFEQQQQKS